MATKKDDYEDIGPGWSDTKKLVVAGLSVLGVIGVFLLSAELSSEERQQQAYEDAKLAFDEAMEAMDSLQLNEENIAAKVARDCKHHSNPVACETQIWSDANDLLQRARAERDAAEREE